MSESLGKDPNHGSQASPGFDLPTEFTAGYLDGLEKDIALLARQSKLTFIQSKLSSRK